MKKFIALIFAALFAAGAFAHQNETTVNGVKWYYNRISDGKGGYNAEITYRGSDYYLYSNGYSGALTIPSTLGGYPVTTIGYNAFYDCSSLTSVTIPDSVTTIGYRAFYGCSSLTSVTIPNGVTSIGSEAFDGCSSLTSVTIPDSVTTIGDYAFDGCSSLKEFVVGENNSNYRSINGLLCTKDGKRVVFGVNGDVMIPDGVTAIGERAFDGCSSLTSITIPDSVTEIGSSAFSGCSSLTSVTIPGRFCLSNVFSDAYKQISSIEITSGVTSIRSSAFSGCSSLTSVTIPNSVTTIGGYAFDDCSSLTSVTIPDSVTTIGSCAFRYCSSLKEVHITDLAKWCAISFASSDANPCYYAKHLYLNGEEIKDLVVPDSVTTIGSSAFCGCSSLTSITIPDSVTSIGYRAFYNCSKLTSVTIPDSVTTIGARAFDGCSSLTSVTIPNSVTSIGANAFDGCSSLKEIIGWRPECPTNVERIVISDSVTMIGYRAFYGCSSLTSVTIPNSVTTIGEYAFYGTPFYNNQPDGLVILGNGCLYKYKGTCPSSVTIPEGVTTIGYDAFFGCSSLASIEIPDSVTSIGSSAFYRCSSLASVTIPNSVTSIGYDAFYGCSSLKELVLPPDSNLVPSSNWGLDTKYIIRQKDVDITVSVNDIEIVYDGLEHSLVFDLTANCVDFPLNAIEYLGEKLPSLTSAGEKAIHIEDSDFEYNESDVRFRNVTIRCRDNDSTLKVLPRKVSITSASATKVYDGKPFMSDSIIIEGAGFVTGECSVVALGSQKNVGMSKNAVALNWAEGASADNYAITIKEGTLTITPAKVPRIATTAFSTTYSYDGEEHTINVVGVESTTLIDPPRFSYALSAEGPWQDEAPTFKDAGRHTVWYKISADNYEDYIQEACVTILPRKIVVESGSAEKFYDGVPLTCGTAEVKDGALADETFSINVTGAQLDEGESQNTFDIVWDGSAKESNYEVLKNYGTLKVTRLFGDVGDDTISATYPYSYKSLTEVTFREGVEMITYGQFSGCDSLRTVKLPDSLRVIDCHALDGLPNVEWQIIDGYKMMDGWIFGYTEDAAEKISNVDDIRGIAAGALDGCQAIRRFVCSESSKLKAINSQAFRYCTKLETVVLPEGLERIDDEAFIGCTKMTNVIVPGSVESIGDRAFKQCTMLTNAQIAHGVKSIGEEAFHSDWRIAEVDIPSTVTNVGSFAFGGDSSIVRAGMRGDIRKISEVFSNYDHIREFIVKEGDGELVDALFDGCRELVAVRIMGDCPKMANDGENLYRGAGIVEMGPDDDHSENWINEKATITYVTEGSTGWDGIPGSEALPQAWPLTGGYRRSIALWDVPTYLCQFDANGGTLGVQDTYQYSEKKIALPPEPVQSGYTFDGWWTQPIGGLRVTENTTFIEGVYTYLWAHWVKGHWVFLDPNGGECVNEFVTYVDQSVYGVLPTPVKSGYSFGGWLYNGCVIEPETEINEKSDHTLVAQWTANKYKVQYNPNGGVGDLINEDWVYGETKTLRRNAFMRSGYDFVGWSTSATATKAQYMDEEPLTSLTAKADEVVVLYAVWEKSAAIDLTNVTFTNAGEADWQRLAQLVTKTEGAHSVATPVVWQSGKIADNQSSILKTKVSGKGKLEFWWRVNCESFRTQKLDHLSFVVDGDEVKWINGEKDWTYFEHEILTSGEHEIAWAYNKDDMESGGEDCGAVCAVVWTPRLTELADYLNAEDLMFVTSGADAWIGTTEVSHDGAGAAQSGKIGDNQESRLEVTVNGEGTISFWWKVDCEAYRSYKLDYAAFIVDGVEQKWINGDKDWCKESFEVKGAGEHTLTWLYEKDEEGSDGEDCAWVDEIVWTPAQKPTRPEVIEVAGEEVQAAFDKWIVDNNVTDPSAANVNAFIMGLAPNATEEEIQEQVEAEIENIDISKLATDPAAAVEAIQAKYPNAKVELKPVENITTSAYLYKLAIDLK